MDYVALKVNRVTGLIVTLHGKTVNKVIARARHSPNTFARYLSNTLSVRICKKKQKK